MTETKRRTLMTAQAFAKVFIESADHEIAGGDPSWREEAAMELAAALRHLDPPTTDLPIVDWREVL